MIHLSLWPITLALVSLRRPRATLAIALMIPLVAVPGIFHLRVRTDGHALVPTGAAEIIVDDAIREQFNVHDPIVIVIRTEHPDGVYNTHTLNLVQSLSEAAQRLDGVAADGVVSLASERGPRVEPGTLNFRRFLQPFPQTAQELELLRRDLRGVRLYHGTLVGRDEKSAAIYVPVSPREKAVEVLAALEKQIAAANPAPDEIDIIGAPVAEGLLGAHLLEDLGVPHFFLGATPPRDGHSAAAPRHWPHQLARFIGLGPICVVVMFLVFLITFRTLAAAVVPLMEVGACLLFVFGLMGYCDVPVYLTIAVMPVILVTIGVADELHVFARYRQLLARWHGQAQLGRGLDEQPDKTTNPLHQTMQEMSLPVAKAAITTAVGFASFLTSPLPPVRAFGLFTVVGVLFCMLWSLTAVPAMLALLPPNWVVRKRHSGQVPAESLAWLRCNNFLHRGRWAIVLITVVLMAASPWAIRRIRVQDSWIDNFATESRFAQAIRHFNEQYLGMHTLMLAVKMDHSDWRGRIRARDVGNDFIRVAGFAGDPQQLIGHRVRITRLTPPKPLPGVATPPPTQWDFWVHSLEREGDSLLIRVPPRSGLRRVIVGASNEEELEIELSDLPLVKPANLRRLQEMDTFLTAQKELTVGGTLGPADYLATTNLIALGLKEEERRVPDLPDRVHWLWQTYGRIRDEARLRQLVDPSLSESLTTVFLNRANFRDVAALLQRIREYEEQHLKPLGIRLRIGGDVAVSQTMIDAIVTTQYRSLFGAVVGSLVTMTLLGRSIRYGVICILPCAIGVVLTLAVMGWLEMPMGVATSMFAAMTVGIADDFAIHLLEHYRLARTEGCSTRSAVACALQITGPAVLIDALAIGLGFGVLTLSQVPANARLGIVLITSIAACLLVTLSLLPALLHMRSRTPQRGEGLWPGVSAA